MFSRTGTIEGAINYGKKQAISHSKLHFKTKIDSGGVSIIVNTNSIMDKYWDLITIAAITRTFTDNEHDKYKYQPKLLSYDLYNTTELWSAILKINNIFSATQFDGKTVKVFDERIFAILNEILILEDIEIKKNRSELV